LNTFLQTSNGRPDACIPSSGAVGTGVTGLGACLRVSRMTLAVSLTVTLFPAACSADSRHLCRAGSVSAGWAVNLKQGTEVSARETVEKEP